MNKEACIGKIIDGQQHGIKTADLEKTGVFPIKGLSGKSKLLYMTDGKLFFKLFDSKDASKSVRCTVNPNGVMIAFAKTVGLVGEERQHHPDLFAGQLLRYFIGRIMQEDPSLPRTIKTEWDVPLLGIKDFAVLSDNYDAYMKARKKGLDGKDAALTTWESQLYSSLGFTVKNKKDVDESHNVYVTFRRTN